MAYRISATTDTDKDLLDSIRTLAWKERRDISDVIRSAFQKELIEGQDRINDSEA